MLLALAASVLVATHQHEPDTPPVTTDELRVMSRPHANGTDDLLVTYHTARADVLVHYRLEDPTHPHESATRRLGEWNATQGNPRAFLLQDLPNLLLLRVRPDEQGAHVLVRWIWHGQAHFLVSDSPEGLAPQLLRQEAP